MNSDSSPSLTERVHGSYVHGRRVRVLARQMLGLLPKHAAVLDVGAGDGKIARLITDAAPGVAVTGIDTLVRPGTHVPVTEFDGQTIPFPDASFDYAMLVDVVHHEMNQLQLLRECVRVVRKGVVIKDHLVQGLLAWKTLAFMDRVGNARYGVALPHRYLTRDQWHDLFLQAGLQVDAWHDRLGLYPFPANLLFERKLHFACRLHKISGP